MLIFALSFCFFFPANLVLPEYVPNKISPSREVFAWRHNFVDNLRTMAGFRKIYETQTWSVEVGTMGTATQRELRCSGLADPVAAVISTSRCNEDTGFPFVSRRFHGPSM